MRNERYYYGVMSAQEKQAYKSIYNGLKAHAFNITVPVYLTEDQLQDVYFKVLFDSPLLYYINQTVVRIAGKPGGFILLPEYLYSGSEIASINKDIRRVVERVGVKANTLLNNEFRLEKYLHDSVVKSVAYDYDSLMKTDSFNAHSIVGAFLDNKAVCEGIAKAFKLLCNTYALKCIVVTGKANPNGVYDENSYHAWNLVKVGNESYHVDPTWDNMYNVGSDYISYDYFNVTTQDILKDHRPTGKLPLCTSDSLNYFTCTGSRVSTYQELVDLISQRIHQKTIMFKMLSDKNEFLTVEEMQDKTSRATYEALRRAQIQQGFKTLFNDRQQIGKILLL